MNPTAEHAARDDGERPPRVVILSGPIGSGKTTALSEAFVDFSALGVLAPIVSGRRHLCLPRTGECRLLEADASTPGEIVAIGPHRFSERVFAWARDELSGAATARRSATGPDTRWIIVDEVGPLELRGDGLEPALGALISTLMDAPHDERRLLLVVREGMVDRVRDHYAIPRERSLVVTKDELASL